MWTVVCTSYIALQQHGNIKTACQSKTGRLQPGVLVDGVAEIDSTNHPAELRLVLSPALDHHGFTNRSLIGSADEGGYRRSDVVLAARDLLDVDPQGMYMLPWECTSAGQARRLSAAKSIVNRTCLLKIFSQ